MFNNCEGGRISSIVLQKLEFFFKMSIYTGICHYFTPTTRHPYHKDTGIGVVATCEANGGVKCVLERISLNPIMSNKMWECPKMSN